MKCIAADAFVARKIELNNDKSVFEEGQTISETVFHTHLLYSKYLMWLKLTLFILDSNFYAEGNKTDQINLLRSFEVVRLL